MASGLKRQDDDAHPSLGHTGNPHQLTSLELDFLELMAKGLDPIDISRSLGIDIARGAQLLHALRVKLGAQDDNHLRQLIVAGARALPADRFVILDC